MAEKRSYRSTPRTRRGALTPFGSRTDIGCLRDHNEDSLIVTPPLFAVADGMGGHAAGEVASEIAVHVLAEHAPEHPDGEALARAVEEANHEVMRAARDGRGREGMGTTMTAAVLEGERLVIAQVGDSRAYLMHQGKLQQLTRDHSLMADLIEAGQLTPEEARCHPQRSVITRALGSDPCMHPDMYEINVETGDRLLICSDGLSGMLCDQDIEHTMRRVQDPQRCAAQLVNEAIAAGGHDNVTVIVADVSGFAEARRRKLARKTKLFIATILVLFAAIVGEPPGRERLPEHHRLPGRPRRQGGHLPRRAGHAAGLSFSHLERVTDVSVNDLQPGTANRLAAGIQVDTVDAAEALVREYEAEAAQKGSSEGAGEGGKATGGQDGADNGGTSDNGGGSDNAASGSSSANGSNGSASQGGAA